MICRPVLEGAGYGFDGVAPEKLAELTAQLLRWQDVGDHLAWLYTPLAQPVAQALEPALTIYDYLDERCPILGAPRDLHGQREAERLRAADVAAFATAAGAHSSSESCARLRVGGP